MRTAIPGRHRGSVPWWGLASSVSCPLVLVLGWTIAAELQPGGPHGYDWIRQTVSVLAAPGAADRWVMSLTFVAVGACDLVTGLALRPAARSGRVALVVGAIAGMLVAANPEPPGGGAAAGHAFFAGLGLVALTIWPVAAVRWRQEDASWALRPAVGIWATWVTAVIFAWFLVELLAGLEHLGLAERAVGQMQALWPLVVVLTCRWRRIAPPDADRADDGETGRGYARSNLR